MCSLAIVAPVLLEYAGVLRRTVTVGEGTIVICTLGTLREGPAIAFLLIGSVAMMLSASFFIGRMRDALNLANDASTSRRGTCNA